MNLLEYIPFGRENAISRGELQRLTGLGERPLRTAIKRLVKEGNPILSSSHAKGYWRSEDPQEIKAFVEESDRRRTTEALTVEPLRRLVAKQLGHDVIPVRAHFRHLHKPQEPIPQLDGQINLFGGEPPRNDRR